MNSNLQNIILLSVDALRADHLSSYGYCRETTPNLDRIARDNLTFTNSFSASSHTREAVPALLTGRYPDEAVDGNYRLASDTVAAHLKSKGFATGAFHSNPFVSRAYGFDRRFDKFDDDLYLGKHKFVALGQRAFDKLRNRHYARATEINDRSLDWLDSLDGDRPFFLWNHYMDPHGPYEPPDEYRKRYHEKPVSDRYAGKLYKRAIKTPDSITDSEQQLLVDLYDAEIRYTDEHIQQLFKGLSDRDLLSESLIIITSDHGEAFGEHDYYEHPRYLHRELVHVPLFVSMPGVEPDVIESPVSALDIAATINEVNDTGEALPGESLRSIWGDPPAYEERVVYAQARGEGDDEHLRRFSARSTVATVSLERDSVSGDIVSEDGHDDDLLLSLRRHSAERATDETSQDIENHSDEIERRLEALGYK